jgi:hypothetical protein
MPVDNFRVQFERGTTAEMDAYTGRDGELSIDLERKQTRLHDGVKQGGEVIGSETITVNVASWAGSNWNAPAGVVVSKAHGGSAIRISHNKNKYPTGWFALNRDLLPMVGILPTPTRNIQVEDTNTVLITDINGFSSFDVSIQLG